MKRLFVILFFGQILNAQDSAYKPLVYYFQNGKTTGLWRNHFMITDNQKGLLDFGAFASALHVNYKTLYLKNIAFSAGFASVSNVWQHNLTARDPQTYQSSRYEIGLYDVTNPQNYKSILLLSELALNYKYKNWNVNLGKQLLKTTFINPQDGRMVPTLAEGLYAQKKGKWEIELGYLYRMAPRGVSKWYSVEQSIGVYPQGVQSQGKPSQYAGNTHSNGIGLFGVQKNFTKFIQIKLHDLYVDNLMNTAFVQMDYFKNDTSRQTQWTISGQLIRQDGVGNGGNIEEEKRYFEKKGKSMTFGGRILLEQVRWSISLNYNRIIRLGRYLLPREWGIEPFFTFLPRERSDGFAGVQALALKSSFLPNKTFRLAYQTAYVQLPDVKNYAFNKYGMPSYWQNNLEVRWYPQKFFKSLEVFLLVVYKYNLGETHGDKRYIINRTNMLQWNIVTNYKF